MKKDRKIILYIAMSLDGYIARKNGDIEWLSVVESPGEDYGYNDFIKTIDTVIMGRKTYDKVLSFGIEFPHKNKKCYVITGSERQPDQNVTFYNKNISDLINQLKAEKGKNIFIDGGADLVNSLMKFDAIDEYIISIIPIFVGDGIRLFQDGRTEVKLNFTGTTSYASGLVQLHYTRAADE